MPRGGRNNRDRKAPGDASAAQHRATRAATGRVSSRSRRHLRPRRRLRRRRRRRRPSFRARRCERVQRASPRPSASGQAAARSLPRRPDRAGLVFRGVTVSGVRKAACGARCSGAVVFSSALSAPRSAFSAVAPRLGLLRAAATGGRLSPSRNAGAAGDVRPRRADGAPAAPPPRCRSRRRARARSGARGAPSADAARASGRARSRRAARRAAGRRRRQARRRRAASTARAALPEHAAGGARGRAATWSTAEGVLEPANAKAARARARA